MSKQSKQERATKYADGAREAVRLADLAAQKVTAEIAEIGNALGALKGRIDMVCEMRDACNAELKSVTDALAALNGPKEVLSASLREVIGQVAKAKSTIKETAYRIGALLAEVPVE